MCKVSSLELIEGSVTDLLTHLPAKDFPSPWRTWGPWTLQRALIRNIAACVYFFFKTEEFLLNAILTFDVVSLQFLFWGQFSSVVLLAVFFFKCQNILNANVGGQFLVCLYLFKLCALLESNLSSSEQSLLFASLMVVNSCPRM